MIEPKCYTIKANTYRKSDEVTIIPNCIEWSVINQGDTGCTVNQIYLKPYPPGHPELIGTTFSLSCNEGEVFTGHLTIAFDAAPGADPWIQIVQRYYVGL